MESNGQSREQATRAQGVPLADLERAAAIARGVRRGGPADRRATLEQLLRAFGEADASPRALDRIQRALSHVGVSTLPQLQDAVPDIPVQLSATQPQRGPMARPVAAVAAAIIAVIVLVALGRALGPEEEPGITLPAGTTATTASTPTTTTEAAAPLVTLRLVPTEPGFACAIGEDRQILFRGTLDRPRTIRAEQIRALVTAPAVAIAHGREQKLPGRRIVLVGATKLKVLLEGATYCEEEG